ncbi:MAG: PAS domain-containing protein, partial [Bacteroidota bacterium]|nr:PAS domain-containing protein [Bacteroidota bacterium]
WNLNLKNEKTSCNEKIFEIFGIPAESQISLEKLLDKVAPEDLPSLKTSIQNVAEHHSTEYIDYKIITPNNTFKYIHSGITIIKNKYNEPEDILGITFDITINKKTEERIKWLANLPEHSPNYVMCINFDYKIIYANESSYPLMKLMIDENSQNLNSEWKSIIDKTKDINRWKTEVICAGRIIFLTLAKNPDSDYINIYGVDITERKEAELVIQQKNEALAITNENLINNNEKLKSLNEELVNTYNLRERSEEKFRLLFENMPLGIATAKAILNKDGKPIDFIYISVNEEYVKLVDIKESSLIGKTLLQVMPQIEKEWLEVYTRVVTTGESEEFEHYRSSLGKYLKVKAYSPEKNNIVVIVENIKNIA